MKFECKFIFPRFLNDEHYLNEREQIIDYLQLIIQFYFMDFFQCIKQLI